MKETIKNKERIISKLKTISNHALKNGVVNLNNKYYRDFDLVTKTDLLQMSIIEILNYKIFGYSSTSYQEHFNIYVHRKNLKNANDNLELIKR